MSYAEQAERACLDREDAANARQVGQKADAEIAALRARVEALEAALREVCDDYEEVIDGEFGPNPMPIQPVVRARALLEKQP